jgi:protein-tyrosine phosphatase
MKKSVMFVCLGNICRSPAAEGILRDMSSDINVASCGLGSWHVGELPDGRMREVSKSRGIILNSRAQAFQESFFNDYDYIFAADQDVLQELKHRAVDSGYLGDVFLFTHFSKSYKGQDIPDPYYGGHENFEYVLDMLADCCRGIIDRG